MVKAGASDLHIKAGSPPGFRIDSEVVPQSKLGRLTPEQTSELARQLMSHDQWERFLADKDIDFDPESRQHPRHRWQRQRVGR